jgi:hypothetical protein
MNSDCNDFVARVALEVVDSAWWKQQLRVKSAGGGTTALSSSNQGASWQPLFSFGHYAHRQHERSQQNKTVLHFNDLTPTGELHNPLKRHQSRGRWIGP